MNLVGLESITSYVDKNTLDTFPHSLILLGREGSGKRATSEYIAEHLKLNLVDITENLSEDLINSIYRNPTPQIYRIDIRELAEKKQNILLKLFEEPGSAFVIVIANTKFQLLTTVLNRGVILEMPPYTRESLEQVARDNNITVDNNYIKLLRTPGDVLKLYSNNVNVESINELSDKIITSMGKASFPNMLLIVDKMNFKDEYDKIDLDMFLRIFYSNIVEAYIKTKNETYYSMLNEVKDTMKRLNFDSRLNKKILFTNMLIKLWRYAK